VTQPRHIGALLVVGLALTACTSSGSPHGATTSALPVTSAPVTSAAPSTAPVGSSSAPSTAPASTSSSAATQSSAPPKSTCTDVSIRILPGGASPGQEIAAVQFTNAGSTPCLLVGYPTVQLFLHNQLIGTRSQPSTPGTVSSRRLAPGEVAESLVHDYTQTCQAPLSDTVRVIVPGSTQTYLRPGMQLRACLLKVDKLGAPE
jgi:uncharacterized protein DUF4232